MKLFLTKVESAGHQGRCLPPLASIQAAEGKPLRVEPAALARPEAIPITLPSFEVIYEEHFNLVFRNIRRLGVPEAHIDDAVQEVFLVVYRRLSQFEGRSTLKTWIISIVMRVASEHRRAHKRKSPHQAAGLSSIDADSIADDRALGPEEAAERLEGARLLHRLLDTLDDEKRTVLVLAELELMSAREIAEALGENINTVSARLRAARRDFDQAVARERARDTWRLR